jgi:hypothetical protein
LHCKGDYSQLQIAWLSLLAVEGCIIHRRASEKHAKLTALVVGSTYFGLVLWELKGARYGSLNYFTVVNSPDAMQFWPITTLDQKKLHITACKLKATPPARIPKGGRQMPAGMVLTLDGHMQPLLQFAASCGFCEMYAYHLQKLVALEQLSFEQHERPNSEKELVEALVRHALPKVSAAELEAAVAQRGPMRKVTSKSLLLEGENLEMLAKSIDADDLEEMKRHKAEMKKVAEAVARATSSTRSSASAHPAAPQGLQRIPYKDEYTKEEAERWIPKVHGCTVTKDVVRHFRWVIAYPNEQPPFSVSKAWRHAGISELEALRSILKVVWGWHARATGEPCPWDLS